jgi:hypothetical protein
MMVKLKMNGKEWIEPSKEEALNRIQMAEVIEGFDLVNDFYEINEDGVILSKEQIKKEIE